MLPSDDAADLTWLLFRQQDVITFRQARRFFTEAAIRHRLRSGRWSEPHPRVFVAHGGAPVTDAQRLWIAVLAAGPGALGRWHGNRYPASSALTRPNPGAGAVPRCLVHRPGELLRELPGGPGGPCTHGDVPGLGRRAPLQGATEI